MQFVMPSTAPSHQQQQQQQSSRVPVPQTVPLPATNANYNNNPFGIPTTSDGVPLFTVEQLQMLQRQTLSRISQQQQQQQQHSQQSQPQTSSRPFMVVTQVPVQAVALFASAAAGSTTDTSNNTCTNSNVAGASMASNMANNGAAHAVCDWADLLQPTPLSPQYEQQHNHFIQSHQGQGQNSSQSHCGANPAANTSQQAAAVIEHHFQQLAQQPKNPETEELLKQLLRNAQAASHQQQHQQQQPPIKQQLYALSSGVEPLQISSSANSSTSDPLQDSFAWKMFMDEDEDPMKNANKRKLEGDPSVNQPMLLGATTSASCSISSNKSNDSSNRRSPSQPVAVPSASMPITVQSSTPSPMEINDFDQDYVNTTSNNDDDPLLDPTPLSEILSMRAASPDDSLSLSDQMQGQFQLQQQSQGGDSNSPRLEPMHTQMQQQPQQQAQQQAQGNTRLGSDTPVPAAVSSASHHLPSAPSASSSPAFHLPSTMVPPSVLASVLPPSATAVSSASTLSSHSSSCSSPQQQHPKQRKFKRQESPQHVLERLLQARGIRGTRIKADEAGYDTTPSPLQLASFGTELVKAIHASNAAALGKLLSVGLSANPCNQFRDSIVDLVCKRGNAEIFQTLVAHGCDVQVCDGFGRTPLHHTCWASFFCKPIAQLILERDWMQLLIEDKRGQTPLEYVRPDLAQQWVDFLEEEGVKYLPSNVEVRAPNLKQVRGDGHLPDPPNALPVQLAAAVSSGHMTLEEVQDLSPEVRAKFH